MKAWPAMLMLAALPAAQEPEYVRDIKPLLDASCAGCHSHAYLDKMAISGGLALDSYEAVLRGSRHAVVAPGNAGSSELVRRLESSDPGLRMPRGGAPMLPESVRLIRQWIDAGAKPGQPASSLAPVDTNPAAPVSLRLTEIFVPYGRRVPVKPSRNQASRPKPVLDIPSALVVEDEAAAERIVTSPYQTGLEVSIGPLAPVTAITFHPDGKRLLTGAAGRVVIWDLERRAVSDEISGVSGRVNSLEFSPDGKLLSAAGGKPFSDGEIRLYDARNGFQPITRISAHKEVILDQAFSPDSARLATVSFDRSVELWDVNRRERIAEIRDHSDTVQCVAFDPAGKRLATGAMDRTVKVSDGTSGKGLLTINPELKGILAVAFSPDGRYIITAGESPELHWWELADIGESVTERGWKAERKMAGHVGPVYRMRFSPDGSVLATASADQTLRLWDGKSGQLIRTLVDADDLLYTAAFSPDSRLIAAGGGDGITRVWEVSTGRLIALFVQRSLQRNAPADWLAVDPDGRYNTSAGLQGRVRERKEAHAKAR